jgi:hypothetical protein
MECHRATAYLGFAGLQAFAPADRMEAPARPTWEENDRLERFVAGDTLLDGPCFDDSDRARAQSFERNVFAGLRVGL